MEDKFYYLWLSKVDGVGMRNANLLVDKFGDPEEIWNLSFEQLVSAGISKNIASRISKSKDVNRINSLINELREKDIKVLTLADAEYPSRLRNIYNPPIILYIRGELPDDDLLHFSVIGTRECSEYGANAGFAISKQLAREGAVIVSGMAKGIDSVAHKGCLSGGGKTIAVLGCGVDVCYPPENERLMKDIIKNGCVISEYPPGTKPLQGNFPARNRIISGLSGGLLVVEAGERSGTLITVDYALEQGRDVFAVPGNITSRGSLGTNKLIRQGAILATDAKTILEELKFTPAEKIMDSEVNYKSNITAELEDDERLVYGYIGNEPIMVDVLSRKTGFTISTMSYILTCLEMNGLVKRIPGNKYIRTM